MAEEQKYFSIVTDVGNAEMMKAMAEERKISINEFAVGDGGGAYYKPDTSMTRLKNELWRGQVNSCAISKESENILEITAILPGTVGGFTVREMGVFDSNGKLIAVCNTPDSPKVKVTDGVVHEMNLAMEIVLVNGDTVQLIVNPNVVTATKQEVDEVQKDVDTVKEEVKEMKIETTEHTVTLTAQGWQGEVLPFTQTVEITGITRTAEIGVTTTPDVTAEQLDVIQSAVILGGTQTDGSFTVQAFGEKPTVDLPILVVVTDKVIEGGI